MPYTEAQKRSHIHEIQSYLYILATQDARIPTVTPDGIYGRSRRSTICLPPGR